MRFELARMFLSPRKQVDVFERRNPDGSPMTREKWIRAVFGERIDFVHRKAQRRFDPDVEQPRREHRIVARIGRETLSQESDPENHLRDMVRPQWKACLVIIDPSTHGDGQKVAIESGSQVGSGFGNLESLVTQINSRTPPEPFAIELNPITDQSNFWDYIERNKGNVTSITIEVAMPNMFGGSSSFEEDAKRLRDIEKARKLKETIENQDGLEPDTPRMREAVSYATRGGGKLKAKAKNAPPYDSAKDKKFLDVDVDSKKKDVSEKTDAALSAFDQDSQNHTATHENTEKKAVADKSKRLDSDE